MQAVQPLIALQDSFSEAVMQMLAWSMQSCNAAQTVSILALHFCCLVFICFASMLCSLQHVQIASQTCLSQVRLFEA